MNRAKLNKLWFAVQQARRSPQNAAALQKFAKQLGRRKENRGKEPTWTSDQFSDLRPLSIPDHGGRDLAPGTKNNILNQLEDDLIAWDGVLTEQEKIELDKKIVLQQLKGNMSKNSSRETSK